MQRQYKQARQQIADRGSGGSGQAMVIGAVNWRLSLSQQQLLLLSTVNGLANCPLLANYRVTTTTTSTTNWVKNSEHCGTRRLVPSVPLVCVCAFRVRDAESWRWSWSGSRADDDRDDDQNLGGSFSSNVGQTVLLLLVPLSLTFH